jgi:arylsulfatase A-like enzyme
VGVPETPPNIVLILVDDADAKVLEHAASSRIKNAILTENTGATATRYLNTHPLCSPSRASILRGMYPQNTGVDGNDNAYCNFKTNGGETSNIALWLQAAPTPYHTGMIGKYINGYSPSDDHKPANAGWDYWFGVGHQAYDSYDYHAWDDYKSGGAGIVHYGSVEDDPANYLTDVLKTKAVEFLDHQSSAVPFFLMITPMAPHSPSIPSETYSGMYGTEAYPKVPAGNLSFNEANVSDKPYYVSMLPTLTLGQQLTIDDRYAARLECMESVADLVIAVIDKLDDIDPGLSNTYVFFTSDHGFHMGEHRLGNQISQDDADGTAPGGKNSMYEEDIRVPLWVRGPGIAEDTVITDLIGNVDLAPTFCDIAGVEWDTNTVDGRSFLPLLHGQTPLSWRTQYLISRGQTKTYAGIRSADEWVFGELDVPAELEIAGEYYDLTTDPYELSNGYAGLTTPQLSALRALVDDYRQCAGDACRTYDSQVI